jgi:hypothetical protein
VRPSYRRYTVLTCVLYNLDLWCERVEPQSGDETPRESSFGNSSEALLKSVFAAGNFPQFLTEALR